MSERITQRDLEAVCARINRMMNGTDQVEPWTRTSEGLRANIGVFYIDGAYGGVELYRMANEHGGVEDVLRSGHVPKRELYALMHAYIRGIEAREAFEAPIVDATLITEGFSASQTP